MGGVVQQWMFEKFRPAAERDFRHVIPFVVMRAAVQGHDLVIGAGTIRMAQQGQRIALGESRTPPVK